jgi:hypothetical protein
MDATTIFFFLNHILRKTRRTSGEPTERTSSIFPFLISFLIVC